MTHNCRKTQIDVIILEPEKVPVTKVYLFEIERRPGSVVEAESEILPVDIWSNDKKFQILLPMQRKNYTFFGIEFESRKKGLLGN